jgi:hypothetical protein
LERSIFWEMIKLWCQDFGRISWGFSRILWEFMVIWGI